MKIIDLSHSITAEMPVYPGTLPPIFETANTLEKDGFIEKKITIYSHTGTHIDVPAHILKDGLTLDGYNAEYFIGKAAILDVGHLNNTVIDIDCLIKYKNIIENAEYLLLNTGWSKYWGTGEYFVKYPVLTKEGAEWLAGFSALRGIGVDAISVDREGDYHFPIHHIFLKEGKIIIENITNLSKINAVYFTFFCLPLKIKDGDGSPVRAVAIII